MTDELKVGWIELDIEDDDGEMLAEDIISEECDIGDIEDIISEECDIGDIEDIISEYCDIGDIEDIIS